MATEPHIHKCDFCELFVDDREIPVVIFRGLEVCDDCYENSDVDKQSLKLGMEAVNA